MLRINENDFGLNDLAGLALTFIDGQDLPNDLYVYGLSNDWPAAVYIDPDIPNAERVAAFIRSIINEEVIVGLPTRPRVRPAIGIARRYREPRLIETSTRIAVFTLFAANNRINFTVAPIQYRVNDVVHYPVGGGISLGIITEINGETVTVRNFYTDVNNTTNTVLIKPARPTDNGQRARPTRTAPTYANGAHTLDRLTENHVGVVERIRNDHVVYSPDNNPYGPHYLEVDIHQMIRVAQA